MKTRSPTIVAPRFTPMPASLTIPPWRGSLYDHSARPVVASSACSSFHPVTYMMPSTTTGVSCGRDSGIGSVQTGARRCTFDVLI